LVRNLPADLGASVDVAMVSILLLSIGGQAG